MLPVYGNTGAHVQWVGFSVLVGLMSVSVYVYVCIIVLCVRMRVCASMFIHPGTGNGKSKTVTLKNDLPDEVARKVRFLMEQSGFRVSKLLRPDPRTKGSVQGLVERNN